MTFTDASPEMENMMTRNGDHCCVSFRSSRGLDLQKRNAKYGAIAIVAVTVMCVTIIMAIITSKSKSQHGFDLN